ncbi:NAD-dependent epimerase/dehydratase family protein [uncultured Desulfuromonas sp.]|uniref:NAD-dependent epimerase/dehydratase family protein n=1 Tax=uncultured Desulfuromonas sp. TaxID=181013 RepID=UPI002AAAA7A8|nr:NAD-dependent epimerase/dehydratase family protein [uncultured Desulfuromonas sp.]
MHIIVTGGAGFIGSHLTEMLLAQGHSVTVIDNFTTGKRSNLPKNSNGLTIHELDICNFEGILKHTKGADAIVHLAAVASVQASVDAPRETHTINLDGTINMLEVARIHDISTFVFASSAAIYGNNQQLPIKEDTPPSPLTPYAIDKLGSEYYINFYRRQFGLKTTIFRFFNVYGPRQDPSSPYSGVISILMDRAQNKRPFIVFGDGSQSRDFIFVKDLAEILCKAATQQAPSGHTINLGNGIQTTLLDLLSTVEFLSGNKLQSSFEAPRSGDIKHSCADNSRLKQLFSYTPKTSIAEGLKQIWAFVVSE